MRPERIITRNFHWNIRGQRNIVRAYKVCKWEPMSEGQATEIAAASESRLRPGTGTYDRGRATARAILEVAHELVIDHGMQALSMRRIARELAMSPGNLSYYYASKSDLISDLVDYVLEDFMAEFERLRELEADSPRAQLRAVLEYVFDDLSNRNTTYFFPELWVLALRHDWAKDAMERMYGLYRSVLIEILTQLRPDLDEQKIADIAIAQSAAIEGHTVFIGCDRSHEQRAPFVKSLIIEQLVDLAVNAPGGKKAGSNGGKS